LNEAFDGADIILNQIRVGGFRARYFDEAYPTKWGLLGEETLGLGGFFNATRTIPVVLDLAHLAESLAPNAWWVNLTNPAGMVLQAITQKTHLRAVSLCDIPAMLLRLSTEMLENSSIECDYVGVNHIGWLTGARSQMDGENLLPRLIQRWDSTYPIAPADLFADGIIAAPYVRYLYYPEDFHPKLPVDHTRALELIELENHLFTAYRDLGVRALPDQVSQLVQSRHAEWYREVVVPVLGALSGSHPESFVLQVPVMEGAVEERPVLLDRTGFSVLPAWGTRPNWMEAMIQSQRTYESTAVEAILSHNVEAAIHALGLSPWVKDRALARTILSQAWDAVYRGEELGLMERGGKSG